MPVTAPAARIAALPGLPRGEAGDPDDGSRYYDRWLAALERLVTAKHLVDATELARRRQDWHAAYLATPHGQPVELAGG